MTKLIKPKGKDPTITALEEIVEGFDAPSQSFQDIFETTIKPVIESPYLFNNFHWVTNILNQKLDFVHGVEHILGYKNADFSLEKSVEIIHPNYRDFVVEYGLMAYRMLREPRYNALSSRSHYCIQYPVRRADGKYILVQMNATVIQTDKEGNPIANYNRFDILGTFLEVPILIRPRVYFRDSNWGILEQEAEKDISERVSKIMLERLKITPRELTILKDFALDLGGIEIAEKLKIAPETVKHHSKKILKKARIHLSQYFKNVKEVAIYLKNIEII
jgi:DNA-binding CsgD family transcriptional regulator